MSESPPITRPSSPGPSVLLEALLVGAGGAIGAVLRAGVAALIAAAGGTGMAATQVVNLAGTFALGVFLAGLDVRGPAPRWRAFFAVGVVASFTTFSGLVGETRTGSAAAAGSGDALLFLSMSLLLGIAAFCAGQLAGRTLFAAPDPFRGAGRETARDPRDRP